MQQLQSWVSSNAGSTCVVSTLTLSIVSILISSMCGRIGVVTVRIRRCWYHRHSIVVTTLVCMLLNHQHPPSLRPAYCLLLRMNTLLITWCFAPDATLEESSGHQGEVKTLFPSSLLNWKFSVMEWHWTTSWSISQQETTGNVPNQVPSLSTGHFWLIWLMSDIVS